MAKAPCCEKMGMRKGPWTPEEDQILISYIQRYGHGNWRALPKQAGLPRCGKSCRLRWINYLRPDIKRGNFTSEEEETIFKLHQSLGNRWSAIAARLPGRTDNEIKNYWHGRLKKKLKQSTEWTDRKEIREARIALLQHERDQSPGLKPSMSSQHSQLEPTFLTAKTKLQQPEELALTREQQGAVMEPAGVLQLPFSYVSMVESMKNNGSNMDANMDYWYQLLMETSDEAHGNIGHHG